jgi:isoamylase
MYVDGFRFDEGNLIANPLVVWAIELSAPLAETKVVTEAWNAQGGYLVGSFPGHRWASWSGLYRDELHDFVRAKAGMLGIFARRITGRADLYQHQYE